MSCIRMWSYIQWVTSFATHATCPITFMDVKIQWVANCHYNSKLSCNMNCKTPFFLIMSKKSSKKKINHI
jgi:hypothetical protein